MQFGMCWVREKSAVWDVLGEGEECSLGCVG